MPNARNRKAMKKKKEAARLALEKKAAEAAARLTNRGGDTDDKKSGTKPGKREKVVRTLPGYQEPDSYPLLSKSMLYELCCD